MRPTHWRLLVGWALARSVSSVETGSSGSSPGEGSLSLSDTSDTVTSLTDASTTWGLSTTALDVTTSSLPHNNETTSTSSSTTTTSSSSSTWMWTLTWSTSTKSSTLFTISTRSSTSSTTSTSSLEDSPTTTLPECISIDPTGTYTSIIVSYTATITFTGDPADYTPPHEPISLPSYCDGEESPPDRTSEFINLPSTSIPITASLPEIPRPTFSFITTDKNPSVIFEPDTAPGYTRTRTSPNGDNDLDGITKHKPTDRDERTKTKTTTTRRPPFIVTAGPGQVIIGTSTITGLVPDKTTTVTVSGGTFTINPTAIIGEGATVTKPPPPPTHSQDPIFPKPTSGNVGGLELIVSGSLIVADGTATMTVPREGLTTVVNGETVSAGPGRVIVGEETLVVPTEPAHQTDLVVIGGDMLTARDSTIVVLHSTTITYGPGIDQTTLAVDDDIITVNSDGIFVHGTTLGGPGAGHGDTKYEVVGGVTITEIGTTAIVIGGHTYTIGPGAGTITTTIAGQTLTIGPDGVTVGGTMTLSGAGDDPTVVATIEPSGTWVDDLPSQTEASTRNGSGSDDDDDDDEDGAHMLIPGFFTVLFAAFGVCVLAGGYV